MIRFVSMKQHLLRCIFGPFIFCVFVATAHSQGQSAVAFVREYGYQQSGAETVAPAQATLSVSLFVIQWIGSGIPSSLPVSFHGGPTVYIVDVPNLSPASTTRTFATFQDLDLALPAGGYMSAAGTPPVTLDASPFVSPPTVTNFDALQKWTGGKIEVNWTSPKDSAGATPETSVGLEIARADGTLLYPTTGSIFAPGISGTTRKITADLATTVTPGDTVYGKLRFSWRSPNTPGTPVTLIGGGSTNINLIGSGGGTSTLVYFNGVSTIAVAVRFPIHRALTPPAIKTQPNHQTVVVGGKIAMGVSAESADPLTYQWLHNGIAIPGFTANTFTLDSAAIANAGTYTVTVTNSSGSVTSTPATLMVLAATVAPTISAAPAALTVLAGAPSSLTVTPAGTAPFTYQWFRDGTALPGATTATLTLETTLPSDAAAYSVRITNSAGSITSPAATLAVTPISRISNISVLTSLSNHTDSFTLGYVVGGNATTGAKPLLLRAAGPALAALGVAGTLDDPQLELFAGSTKTTENDNWAPTASVASTLTTTFTSVGAFPFASPTSKDAAVTASLTTRDNSVKISAASTSTSTPPLPSGAAAAPGLVLAEIYDASPTDTFTTTTPRLLNVSVLKSLGTGLTVGFTIAGSTAKTVLIRAIGPTLGEPPFGVPGTVADPQLALFSPASPTPLATNDNWSVPVASAPNATALTAAFTSVGAFALPPNSRDAALLTTLPPGGYSVQVTGVNNTTGAALVEVYEVP